MKDTNKLVEDHWQYLKSLLETHGVESKSIEVIGFHYRTAMLHGYKHGVEDCSKNLIEVDLTEVKHEHP